MTDLTDFLLARIAEDEAVARATLEPVRNVHTGEDIGFGTEWEWYQNKVDQEWAESDHPGERHVARHDPDRVLRECEAKRRIVDLHKPLRYYNPDPTYTEGLDACNRCGPGDHWSVQDWSADELARVIVGCDHIRILAAIWADHADYRQEWRP